MDGIVLKISDSEAIPLIKELAHRIWWAHYPEVIPVEQITYMLDLNYSEDALLDQMKNGSVFHLIYEAGTPIGFVAIAPSKKDLDSFFIHKFYVDTGAHGKGVGTDAFRQVMSAYPKAKEVRLAVNRQNYKSINFYFKNGFKIEKCLDTEIGNGYVMDDFIMVCKFEEYKKAVELK